MLPACSRSPSSTTRHASSELTTSHKPSDASSMNASRPGSSACSARSGVFTTPSFLEALSPSARLMDNPGARCVASLHTLLPMPRR
eukprot:6455069-Prymnesium_polylepis.1